MIETASVMTVLWGSGVALFLALMGLAAALHWLLGRPSERDRLELQLRQNQVEYMVKRNVSRF